MRIQLGGTMIRGNQIVTKITGGGQVVINGRVVGAGNEIRGNGQITEEKREICQDFDRVEFSAVKAEVKVGKPNDGLTIKGDSNILSHIESRVENGTLKVGVAENSSLMTTTTPEVTFYMADLQGIAASAAAIVTASDLFANKVRIRASSGASVKVNGEAQDIRAKASSGGFIDTSAIQASAVDATASSGGTVITRANEEMEATASSGGNVMYFGTAEAYISSSSGGSVRKLE